MTQTFEHLIAEAVAAPVDGWDFSWLDGRATEERPSWGYQRLMSRRLATASAALDLDTGGGEVLAGAQTFPPTMVATETWPPNAALATKLLHPRGVVVVATGDPASLPFANEAFDLVTSRHPIIVRWSEIARVLRPGGCYLAQQIGPTTMAELVECFIGPQPHKWAELHPDTQSARARAAGLEVVGMRMERLRAEFFDIAAVIYFLRKVIWTVPDFSVDRYHDRLRELHERIEADGPFVAHLTRVLVEARKPSGRSDCPNRTWMRRSADEHAGDGRDGCGRGCVDRGHPGGREIGRRHLAAAAGHVSEHKHEMIADLHCRRHGSVRSWRAGLATARDTYRQWAAGPRDQDAPNVVGDEWFEGLRPHLPTTGETAEYRTAHEVHCDDPTVALLSLEIGRVEREWVDEAKSYRRAETSRRPATRPAHAADPADTG